MRKHIWLPYIAIFLFIIAVVITITGASRAQELTSRDSISVERRVAQNGTIYEIIDVGENKLALREIKPSGQVSGYINLPSAKEVDDFSVYHMVGLIDSSLYLYNYLTPGDAPTRYKERLIAYDMTTGDMRIIAELSPPEGDVQELYDVRRIYYFVNGYDDSGSGSFFLGYYSTDKDITTDVSAVHDETHTLTVRHLDTKNGEVLDTFTAAVDVPLNAITVTSGGIFFEHYGADEDSGPADVHAAYSEAHHLTLRHVDVQSGEISDTLFTAEVDFPLNTITMTNDNELFALAQDSRVFRLDDGTWVRVFAPAPGEVVANMTVGSDGAVYLFLVSQSGTRVGVLYPAANNFVPLALEVDSFTKLHFMDRDNWIAMNRAGNYITAAGGDVYEIDELHATFSMLWNGESMLIILLVMVLTAIVLLVTRHVLLRKKFRLLPKILLIQIPILAVGMFFIVSTSTNSAREAMTFDIQDSLLEATDKAANNINGERFAAINWDEPYSDEYFLELREYIAMLSKPEEHTMVDYKHNDYDSYWIYRISDGKVITAVSGYHIVGLEVEYLEAGYPNSARDRLLAGAQETQITMINGIDSEMAWIALLKPIFSDDKELVAILEVAQPVSVIEKHLDKIASTIIKSNLITFIIILLVFIPVLAFSMRTLGKLKRGALAVSSGDYSTRVHARSWDETGEISIAFNKMAESVENSVSDITAIGRGYSRFVSDKLIELLGKQSIKEVMAGDYANMTASHVLMFTESFDKVRKKDFFDALDRFYNLAIPCVTANGGLISRYSARGFAAIYDSEPENALRSMFAMYAELDKQGDRVNCNVFLSYSNVMLGVTGNGEYLNMITVSRLVYESYAVGNAGKRFGSRIIVAHSAFTEMGEATRRYRYRFIGYHREDDENRPLYDFYDCDPPEKRLKKDETRESFELGVRLYWEREYSKARSQFVDIIKAFPEDAAAREYLRLAHSGQEYGGDPKPLFELR